MGRHDSDIRKILDHRHDNGADFWSTGDGRIYVGNPFSTLASLGMLHELGVGHEHEAARVLCRFGVEGRELDRTVAYLLEDTHETGRWRCRFSRFEKAKRDVRFRDALAALRSKRDDGGRMIVERAHRSWKGLAFCAKGEPSELATGRFREIEANLAV